jgi:uncharacterized OB-fold protein
VTSQRSIPLPVPSPFTKPFWEGCRRQELLVQKCQDCGLLTHVPQPACSHCLSPNLGWMQASGKGAVYSYTVVWRPQTPDFEVPYVVAIVDLDEGVQMMTNIVDVDPAEVHVGMRVEVEYRKMSDEITLPYFRPAAA